MPQVPTGNQVEHHQAVRVDQTFDRKKENPSGVQAPSPKRLAVPLETWLRKDNRGGRTRLETRCIGSSTALLWTTSCHTMMLRSSEKAQLQTPRSGHVGTNAMHRFLSQRPHHIGHVLIFLARASTSLPCTLMVGHLDFAIVCVCVCQAGWEILAAMHLKRWSKLNLSRIMPWSLLNQLKLRAASLPQPS